MNNKKSRNKESKIIPSYVTGLGTSKLNAPCKSCAELTAQKKEFIRLNFDPNKYWRLTDFSTGEVNETALERLQVRCELHRKKVKRRFGSGITRRRWKATHK